MIFIPKMISFPRSVDWCYFQDKIFNAGGAIFEKPPFFRFFQPAKIL